MKWEEIQALIQETSTGSTIYEQNDDAMHLPSNDYYNGKWHGEDVSFIRNSRRKGFKVFATTPYNWVGIRKQNKLSHTWKASDASVIKRSRIVARTERYKEFVTRKA